LTTTMSNVSRLLPLGWRKSFKVARLRLFERLGSQRYSFPALNELDRKLLNRLPGGEGTFLEIGANDGYSQSNTYYLERWKGWRGILIEPHPKLYRRCRRLRARSYCVQAACDGEGNGTIELVDMDLMSITAGLQPRQTEVDRIRSGTEVHGGRQRFVVRTRRLSDIIDESPLDRVTLMTIDVEGAELAVLAGLELDRHCPDVMLVETADVDAVAAALTPWMVLQDRMSAHDFFFVRV
jgi:FkbM family methyltransferase